MKGLFSRIMSGQIFKKSFSLWISVIVFPSFKSSLVFVNQNLFKLAGLHPVHGHYPMNSGKDFRGQFSKFNCGESVSAFNTFPSSSAIIVFGLSGIHNDNLITSAFRTDHSTSSFQAGTFPKFKSPCPQKLNNLCQPGMFTLYPEQFFP